MFSISNRFQDPLAYTGCPTTKDIGLILEKV